MTGTDTSRIIQILSKQHPTSFFLRSKDPFYILISTVLSQRTRDEFTDRAAKQLFKWYKTANQLARAQGKKIEQLIKPSGFYRIKAKRIKAISRELLKNHNGKVPDDIDSLLRLPGVGRKTANCVLVYAFRKAALPVDTHVHRISNLIGWVKTRTPEETEQELMRVIPKKHWIQLNELLVKHGQNICLPRGPKCWVCPIQKHCKHVKITA